MFVCVCVCLFVGSLPVVPLPRLIGQGCLKFISIIIIIDIITMVGIPVRPIDLPRILSHL